MLLGLIDGAGVEGPPEVLRDMNTKEPGALVDLRSSGSQQQSLLFYPHPGKGS